MELASVSVEERCHIDRCVEDVWEDLRDFGNGVGLRADGACCVSLLVRSPLWQVQRKLWRVERLTRVSSTVLPVSLVRCFWC